MLISGILQLTCMVTLFLEMFTKKKNLVVEFLKSFFFSKFFAWYTYLFIATNLDMFTNGAKCSGFLSFLKTTNEDISGTILEQNFKKRGEFCETVGDLWGKILIIPCFIFVISSINNFYIFASMMISRRIKNNVYGFRKNTDPESILLIFYSLNSFFYVYNSNKILASLTMSICFIIGFITTFSRSTFGNQKIAFITSIQFSAPFWVSIFSIIEIFFPQLIESPLLYCILSYFCFIILTVLMNKEDKYLNRLYTPIVRFKEDEEIQVLNMIENLNLMLIESKNDNDKLVSLCGYITRFQEMNDTDIESVISFRKLLDYKEYLPPKKYKENMEEGFIRHISERYIEAIYRYPKSVEIRISFSYFLNDFMQMRNSALEMMKSGEYFTRHSFLLGYQYFQMSSLLQNFDISSSKKIIMNDNSPAIENEQIEYDETEEAQNLSSTKNIFLTSAKEDALIRKNITEMKKNELKNMVKQTIIAYSELWRELQGDSPDSLKVIDYLFNVDYEMEKTEKFWEEFKPFFEENPQALYFLGIYYLVIKHNFTQGNGFIDQAKEIMKKKIKLKFKPKALRYGLDLSECQKPIAYLTKKQVILL